MRASIVLFTVCLGWSSLSGCSFFKELHQKQAKAQEEYHDEYGFVGKEGRAEMPREKETDGLSPWLESPEARAINSSLGYD